MIGPLPIQSGFPYVSLYKFLSVGSNQSPTWPERLIQLLDGECYLPSPADFNDPFDSLPVVSAPTGALELEAWKQRLIGPMANAIRRDIPAWFAEAKVREALDAVDAHSMGERLASSVEVFGQKMGVFCLAETIDSVLMWSHYASNHYGFALEFDFTHSEKNVLLPLWKVTYSSIRPTVRDIGSEAPEVHLADALAVKADFWEYEKEWRVIRPEKARTFLNFDPAIIKGIVFGAKCDEALVRNVQRLSKGRGFNYSKMMPDRDDFRLERRTF